MKIVIAAVSSSGQLSGVQRHAVNLANCLLTQADISQVHFVVASWQRDSIREAFTDPDARLVLHFVSLKNKGLSRNTWYYWKLPTLARQLYADIVHLTYPMPVRRRGFHCPVVMTLHDCYPYDVPENFGFPKVLFNRMVLHQSLEAVNVIACVSKSTLCRLSYVSPALDLVKATVIYNTVSPQMDFIDRTAAPFWKANPFLLCVAQHRRNKNILLTLQAFELLLKSGRLNPEMRIVIVGIEGPETRPIKRFIAKAKLQHHVILQNGISESHLQWSYANCELLLAPSSIEGFGLPVAEALQVGCRIVCSDIQAFREFGDDHCHFVELGKNALRNLAEAVSLELSRPVPPPLDLLELSPKDVAGKYVELYSSLLLDSSGQPSSSMKPRPEMR